MAVSGARHQGDPSSKPIGCPSIRTGQSIVLTNLCAPQAGFPVNAVSVGAIDTPMLKLSSAPGRKCEVAGVVAGLANAESAPSPRRI
jgi:hypothetical protein